MGKIKIRGYNLGIAAVLFVYTVQLAQGDFVSGRLSTLSHGGLILLLAGACVTCTVALTTFRVGYRLFHIPMNLLIGMLAGLHTQPAALGFALERTGNDLPNIGYATVYPIATIAKIIIVQLMFVFLLRN